MTAWDQGVMCGAVRYGHWRISRNLRMGSCLEGTQKRRNTGVGEKKKKKKVLRHGNCFISSSSSSSSSCPFYTITILFFMCVAVISARLL